MNILIADDHELFRRGLEAILERRLDEPRFIHAASGAELLSKLDSNDAIDGNHSIDLILLDLRLPDAYGLELLPLIRQRQPDLAVAVLSAEEDAAIMQAVLQRGCRGYLPKTLETEVLASAVQLVLSGGFFIPQNLFGRGVTSLDAHRSALSERKREVLSLLAAGYSNKRICRTLNLSEGTVKTHIQAIYRELNVNNRIEAANRARDLAML